MKLLSLLAFTMILACGHRAGKGDSGFPVANEDNDFTDATGAAVPLLTSCYQGDAWTCAVEAAIAAKTNEKRSGLVKLQQSFETSYVARVHSLKMAADNKGINHDGFTASRNATMKATFPGLSLPFTAENVAMFSNNEADPEDVAQIFVDMWWKSTGHRENILNKDHRYIGVGVARSADFIYATQIFSDQALSK